tara:strand:+ start:4761 stop:4946 length:186 start_codon:yes stop_codon:yes gene_type:complete
MQKTLNKEDLAKLRNDGTITAIEVAEIVGDLLVITNVETNIKRVVEGHPILTEGTRRILKG